MRQAEYAKAITTGISITNMSTPSKIWATIGVTGVDEDGSANRFSTTGDTTRKRIATENAIDNAAAHRCGSLSQRAASDFKRFVIGSGMS